MYMNFSVYTYINLCICVLHILCISSLIFRSLILSLARFYVCKHVYVEFICMFLCKYVCVEFIGMSVFEYIYINICFCVSKCISVCTCVFV